MKSTLLFFCVSCTVGNALAGDMGSLLQQPDLSWVGSLSLGPVWQNGGKNQTFFLAPEINKAFIADHSSQALLDGEIFLGVQRTLPQNLQGQFGFALQATSNADFSGIIWDDADPQFDNFSYRYKLQHTHVAVKAKLLVDKGYWLIPWVSASLGVGFNNAHSYHNTPLIPEALATPDFNAHTQTSFAYTLGVGFQKALNACWQVGVGYEFADWGQSHLGRAFGQTMNDGLTLNHLYTNGLLFNLTYYA